MNRKPDNERLLDDVLSEAAPADFREAMLGDTLHRVRRRRRWGQIRRTASLVVALGLITLLVWQHFPRHPLASTPMAKTKVKAYELVRTRPLSADAIVATRPFSAGRLVASAAAVEMIQTTSGNFQVLNDNELLALVTSHPAVLIRTGPHSEELVFSNPADAKGFPVN